MEKRILHQLHILDFQMLSWETRSKRKKNDIVVRTLIWIRPVKLVRLPESSKNYQHLALQFAPKDRGSALICLVQVIVM